MTSLERELVEDKVVTRLRVAPQIVMIPEAMGVGANLKRLRENSKQPKSAADVARAAGLSPQKVSDYERGRADDNLQMRTLLKLAKALPCTIEELVEGVDPDYDQARRQRSSYSEKESKAATSPVTATGLSSAQAQPIKSVATGGNPRGSLAHIEDRSSESVTARFVAALHGYKRLFDIADELGALSGEVRRIAAGETDPPTQRGTTERDQSDSDIHRATAARRKGRR